MMRQTDRRAAGAGMMRETARWRDAAVHDGLRMHDA